ncbi:Aminomethyltransferase folate-binding domain-containing protein [Pleurotus eryngii]|uniref:Aminomethyltransferase folate-binding domain-containing protein n=1 Tax=Pleurotus eryngii TaxID=5323 RepID=A0A9P6A764_PLEER|nr:Aminomethyltransferase folate-binding domain-containing protein [Pleurotus eryngii]
MSLPLRCALRSSPTVAHIWHKTVLSVSGSHASQFLNGLLSTPVHDPPRGPFFSAFLHPQGRVIHDIFVYTSIDAAGRPGYLIEYDASAGTPDSDSLLAILKRHVLRSKVKLRDVTSEYDVWAVYGSENESAWEQPRRWKQAVSNVVEPEWSEEEWPWGTEHGVIRDRRAPGMGKRVLVRKGDKPQEASTYDLGSSLSYLLHRLQHGVPEGSNDIPPQQAFPMDSNLDIMGGLDFRKGCYVGQELTVRTYHTGVVRKRILPVVVYPPGKRPSEVNISRYTPTLPHSLDIHARVLRQPGDDRPIPRPRGTGKLLSNVQGMGLALLRTEHVAAVENGTAQLEVSDPKTGDVFQIEHWWPDWWPKQQK